MENWLENRFIKPTINEEKNKYFSESEANEEILNASMMLDFELMRAFTLVNQYRDERIGTFNVSPSFRSLHL